MSLFNYGQSLELKINTLNGEIDRLKKDNMYHIQSMYIYHH